MNQAGAYTQPLVRKSFVDAPVVSLSNGTATTTARLRATAITSGAANRTENAVLVTAHNYSGTILTFRLEETSSEVYTASRTQLGSTFILQPGGETSQTIYPSLPYLELKGIAGNGDVRIQLDSRIEWQRLAFAKDDYTYPTALLTLPSNVPSWSELI